MQPWYLNDLDGVAKLKAAVARTYPDLEWIAEADPPLLRGPFQLLEGGAVLAEYCLEVQLPTDSPRGLPVVFEVGGAIPRTLDRHVSLNGSLCVVLPEAYWFDCPEGLDVLEFLNGPLRAHLAGQTLVAMGKPWPVGEWAHGDDGVAEFYARELQVCAIEKLVGLLGLALRSKAPRQWDCPCGSRQKARRCHGPKIDRIRSRIPSYLLENALRGLLAKAELSQKSIASDTT
jgi:hypothetical protein